MEVGWLVLSILEARRERNTKKVCPFPAHSIPLPLRRAEMPTATCILTGKFALLVDESSGQELKVPTGELRRNALTGCCVAYAPYRQEVPLPEDLDGPGPLPSSPYTIRLMHLSCCRRRQTVGSQLFYFCTGLLWWENDGDSNSLY